MFRFAPFHQVRIRLACDRNEQSYRFEDSGEQDARNLNTKIDYRIGRRDDSSESINAESCGLQG